MKRLLLLLAVVLIAARVDAQFTEQRISGRDYKVYYLTDYGIRGDSVHSAVMHTRLKALLAGKKNASFVCDTNATYIFTYSGADSLVIPEGCAWLQRGSDIRIYAGGQSKGFVLGGDDVIFDGQGGSVTLYGATTLTGHGEYGAALAVGSYGSGDGYSGWSIENVTINTQKADGNGIVVLGDCHDFLISNIHVATSTTMGRGILLHWGGVSEIDTAAGALVTEHPHSGKIEKVKVDSLGYSSSVRDGIYLSACYGIEVSDCQLSHCGRGLTIAPGDYGFIYQDTSGNSRGRSYGQGISVNRLLTWACAIGVEVSGDISQTYTPTAYDTAEVRFPVAFSGCSVYGTGANNGYKLSHCVGVSLNSCGAANHLHGVYVGEGVKDLTVTGCDIYSNAGYGINVGQSITTAYPPDMIAIEGNRLWRNNVNAGIYVQYARRVAIRDNYIGDISEPSTPGEYGQEYGIYINNTDTAMRVALEGNYIRDAQTRCAIRVNALSNISSWCNNTSALDTVLLSGGAKVDPASLDAYCIKGENTDTLSSDSGSNYVGVSWGGDYVIFNPLWISFGANLVVDTSANCDTLHVAASGGASDLWGGVEDYEFLLDNDAESVLTVSDNDAGVVTLSIGDEMAGFNIDRLGVVTGIGDSVLFRVMQEESPLGVLYLAPDGLNLLAGAAYNIDLLAGVENTDLRIRSEGTGRIRLDDSTFLGVHHKDSSLATIYRTIDSVKLLMEDSLDEYEPRWLQGSVDQFILYEPSENDSILYISDDDVNLRTTITTGTAQSGGIDIFALHTLDAQATGLNIYELSSVTKNYLRLRGDSLNVMYDYGADDSIAWVWRGYNLTALHGASGITAPRAYFDSMFVDTMAATMGLFGNGSGDGSFKVWGSTNGSFEIKMLANSGDSMVWVVKDTTAGYVLTTDGAGTVQFAAPTGGTGTGTSDTMQFYVGGVAYPSGPTNDKIVVAFGDNITATRTNANPSAGVYYDSINISATGGGSDSWAVRGDTGLYIDPQDDTLLKAWEASGVVYVDIGNDQTWVSMFENADSVVFGPDGLTTMDSIRMFNYIRFGPEVLDSASVAALLDLTTGAVDSTSVASNALSLDDINWRGEYIELPIVFARGDTPTDSVFLYGPTWREGPVLFHDSTCMGSDVDSVWVGGTIPFACEVDSIIVVYRGDTGGAIDSLKLYGVDRSNGLQRMDSLWYEVDVNLNATTWTRVAYYCNEDVTAGEGFALKFRNVLNADDDWIQVAKVMVWVKR